LIVDVALVPGALVELSFGRLARAALGAQNRAIDAILGHGSLVFASAEELQDLVRLIGDSTLFRSDESNRWREMLIMLRSQHRITNQNLVISHKLKDVESLSDLSDFLSSKGETVLVLPEAQFDHLFPAEQIMATVDQMNSAVIANTLSEASSIKRLRDRAIIGSYPHGYGRDSVWTELFEPLARRGKEIVIFDRYLFARLAVRDRNRGDRRAPEHLVWLLDKIRSSAPLGTVVKLYGGYGEVNHPLVPSSAEDVAALVLRNWTSTPGPVVELEVHIANWTVDRSMPHSRHIRFNDLGFTLDEGFDRLADPTVWDQHGFHWKYLWLNASIQALKDEERYLSKASSAKASSARI